MTPITLLRAAVSPSPLTSDGGRQGDSHHPAEGGRAAQAGQAGGQGRVVEEEPHGAHVGQHQGSVQGVTAGQQEWGGVQQALQLAVRHQGAAVEAQGGGVLV